MYTLREYGLWTWGEIYSFTVARVLKKRGILRKEAVDSSNLLPSSSVVDIFRASLHRTREVKMTRQVCEGGPGLAANVPAPELRLNLRSELVYEANLKIENRFLLAATAMRAARKLHVSSTRTEDTVNLVLVEVANGTRVYAKLPEITPPPAIEELVIAAV